MLQVRGVFVVALITSANLGSCKRFSWLNNFIEDNVNDLRASTDSNNLEIGLESSISKDWRSSVTAWESYADDRSITTRNSLVLVQICLNAVYTRRYIIQTDVRIPVDAKACVLRAATREGERKFKEVLAIESIRCRSDVVIACRISLLVEVSAYKP